MNHHQHQFRSNEKKRRMKRLSVFTAGLSTQYQKRSNAARRGSSESESDTITSTTRIITLPSPVTSVVWSLQKSGGVTFWYNSSRPSPPAICRKIAYYSKIEIKLQIMNNPFGKRSNIRLEKKDFNNKTRVFQIYFREFTSRLYVCSIHMYINAIQKNKMIFV